MMNLYILDGLRVGRYISFFVDHIFNVISSYYTTSDCFHKRQLNECIFVHVRCCGLKVVIWPGTDRRSHCVFVPLCSPEPCTGWGRYGSKMWVEDTVAYPSSAETPPLLSQYPAGPLSDSGWTKPCCPSACGEKEKKALYSDHTEWSLNTSVKVI